MAVLRRAGCHFGVSLVIKDALHKAGELRHRAELAYDQYVAARDALHEIHEGTGNGIKLSAEVDEVWLELGKAPVNSDLVVTLLTGVVTDQATVITEAWKELRDLAASVVTYCEQAKAAADAATATSPQQAESQPPQHPYPQQPQMLQPPTAPAALSNLPPTPGAPAPNQLQPPQPRVNQI